MPVAVVPTVKNTVSAAKDTRGWLTRKNAIEFLRCSVQTLRNYEHKGKLHSMSVMRPDPSGALRSTVVYDPEELTKLPRQGPSLAAEDGELAARSFELFDVGRSVREVVVELRETPDRINELHDKWVDGGGSDIVISPEARASLVAIVGEFSTVAELVAILRVRSVEFAKRE